MTRSRSDFSWTVPVARVVTILLPIAAASGAIGSRSRWLSGRLRGGGRW
ncbi:MAG TPA: hypothetical protein VNO31_35410 [Umezawaea sp.]|nr:hypothetical protein [Umezawaea sp.]